MQVTCFNLHFYSPNFPESLIFYRDVIGIPVKNQFDRPERRGVIFAVNEHTELEFIDLTDRARAEPYMPPPKSVRIKFFVDDVDAEYARLKDHAMVNIIEPIGDRAWGERSFGMQTPDGLILHLCAEL